MPWRHLIKLESGCKAVKELHLHNSRVLNRICCSRVSAAAAAAPDIQSSQQRMEELEGGWEGKSQGRVYEMSSRQCKGMIRDRGGDVMLLAGAGEM